MYDKRDLHRLIVRLTPEQKQKVSELRESGISISTKMRNFIDSLYETEIKSK